jgi:hypothetical protein
MEVADTFKMAFTNFTTGASHSSRGEYLEHTPHERIRYTTSSTTPTCLENLSPNKNTR